MAVNTSPRRFLVPEIIASGERQAGLVALQAILKGLYQNSSPERLRKATAAPGDPNTLETLTGTARRAGLAVQEQIMPADSLAVAGALPALVAVPFAEGVHFLVLWRRVAHWVQVMDSRTGRQWLTNAELCARLPVQSIPIPPDKWRARANSAGMLYSLRARMAALSLRARDIDAWLAQARESEDWQTLARLDAVVRMTDALVAAQALKRGSEAARVVERFMRDPALVVPARYWTVQAAEGNALLERGVVSMQISGVIAQSPDDSQSRSPAPDALPGGAPQSVREVFALMRADGLVTPAILCFALVLATVGVMVQALLFQGILDLTGLLTDQNQRLVLLGAVFVFMLLLFAVEVPINALVLRMGRKLEIRFRLRFLDKIPRLGERFFQGHLKSDLVQRAHSLRQLHLLPELAVTLFRLGFQLVLTTLGILWLDLASAPLALVATALFLALAYFTQPLLQERDYRLRTQMGALSRFYLDAMLGLVPLKMHGAQRAFRREYEALVHDWARANWDLARLANWLQALSVFVYAVFAVWLVLDFIARNGTTAGTLLFFFWILSLPVLATSLVQAIQQYPTLRSLTLRVLEPLNAPEENSFPVPGEPATVTGHQAPDAGPQTPVSISFQKVSVSLGGNPVLRDIQLEVRAGEHIAIVGPSGAGKTTLVGLLLGWHAPFAGECRADGEIVRGTKLQQLRRETVWVDPAIQLWNRTLWENVLYGNAPHDVASTSQAIENADLLPVIEQFDAGLETVLGESGGLVSGGEGQRVRLARAMARAGTRLVILDEPFRGLDRETRRKLLQRARQFWRGVTLLCVTHDVDETRAFERVLVVENGQIVEDAPPAGLAQDPASRYHALLDGEEAVRRGLWAGSDWRRLWIQEGELRERTES